MAFLDWSESLSVGVEQIDRQHKWLVKILNTLHDAMLRGSHKRDLDRVISDLMSYTRYHFSFEEKLMVIAAYPGLQDHRKEHQALVAELEGYSVQLCNGQTLVSIKLLGFLKHWLAHHITEVDRQFGDFEVARHAQQIELAAATEYKTDPAPETVTGVAAGEFRAGREAS